MTVIRCFKFSKSFAKACSSIDSGRIVIVREFYITPEENILK